MRIAMMKPGLLLAVLTVTVISSACCSNQKVVPFVPEMRLLEPGTIPHISGGPVRLVNAQPDETLFCLLDFALSHDCFFVSTKRAWTQAIIDQMAAELRRMGIQVSPDAHKGLSFRVEKAQILPKGRTSVLITVKTPDGMNNQYRCSHPSRAGGAIANTVAAILRDPRIQQYIQ